MPDLEYNLLEKLFSIGVMLSLKPSVWYIFDDIWETTFIDLKLSFNTDSFIAEELWLIEVSNLFNDSLNRKLSLKSYWLRLFGYFSFFIIFLSLFPQFSSSIRDSENPSWLAWKLLSPFRPIISRECLAKKSSTSLFRAVLEILFAIGCI